MTRLAYHVTRVKAEVLAQREQLVRAYDHYPDTTLYWAFLDLVNSSNYRLVRGAPEGYVRGESFYTLVNNATAPYKEIRRLKELGDGALLAADSIRPLFEACLLIGETARELGAVTEEKFPFAVRMAISYGPCKRLSGRDIDDYLGSPIDIAARLVGAADPNQLLIEKGAFDPNLPVLEEYNSFVSFGDSLQLSAKQSKSMATQVIYRPILVDSAAAVESEKGFTAWERSDEEQGG